MTPNKAAAPNAAMTLQFQFERFWRGVGEPTSRPTECGCSRPPGLAFILTLGASHARSRPSH
jgi:hypothetical protein